MENVTFVTSDKKELYMKKWTGQFIPNAIILIAHGMAEHIDRYDDFANYLLSKGFYVYGYDQRGHGKTAKTVDKLGYFAKINGWNRVAEDYNEMYNFVKEKHPDKKIICLGHSMGSFVIRTFMFKYPDKANYIILSGTANGENFKILASKLLAKFIKKTKGEWYRSKLLRKLTFTDFNKDIENSTTEFDWLSKDKKNVRKYIEDPYCGSTFTASFFYDLFKGIEHLSMEMNINKINKESKILILSGSNDPVGEMGDGVQKVYESYKNSKVKNINIKLFEGMRHEILNEVGKTEVYEFIVGWINKNI
ncbi:alpha/beta hydrolase [Helicovermis profundi]|uniref:Alpha/beta hydrolase n=1 Tax=Helicovermis profundi TaxID=3065157 RepID=A0AAU9ENL0_9FIRM|nr:alpha/beta hydrolase [Clostridia bacterium S502]